MFWAARYVHWSFHFIFHSVLTFLHVIYTQYSSQQSFRRIFVLTFDEIASKPCGRQRRLEDALDRVSAQTRVDQNAIFATFVWIALFHHNMIRTKTRRSMATMRDFVVLEQQSSQILFWVSDQHDETMHRLLLIAFFRRFDSSLHHDVAKRFDDSIVDAFFLRICVGESTVQFVADDDWDFVISDARRVFLDQTIKSASCNSRRQNHSHLLCDFRHFRLIFRDQVRLDRFWRFEKIDRDECEKKKIENISNVDHDDDHVDDFVSKSSNKSSFTNFTNCSWSIRRSKTTLTTRLRRKWIWNKKKKAWWNHENKRRDKKLDNDKKKWNEIRENVNFSSIQSFDDREFQNSSIEHFIKQTSRILFFKKKFDKAEKIALMILMNRKISTILFLNEFFLERHFVDDEIWNVWLIRRAKKSFLCLSNCSNSSNRIRQIISSYSFLQIVAIMRDCLFSFSRVHRKIHRVMTLWSFCRSRANGHANQNRHLSRNLRRKRTSRRRQFLFFAINCDGHARIDHRSHASHVDMSNSSSSQSFTFVSSFSSWTIFC